MADSVTSVRVGPGDHGRRMSFAEFQRAEPTTGHRYELARGVIEVTDIPGRTHALVVNEIKLQLAGYWAANQGVIKYLGGGAEAKTEMPGMESERHPDLSIYLAPMPKDEYPWDKWVPSIVIEVVLAGGEAHKRDYETKREEYLAAGVQEYWIVDPQQRSMLALTRDGDEWREHRLAADGHWQCSLMAGFELDVKSVFAVLSD